MLLRSIDRFDELAQFDPEVRLVARFSLRAQPELSSQAVQGQFSELPSHCVCFYRAANDQLHIRVDSVDVQIDEATTVTLRQIDVNTNEFRVLQGGAEVINLQYSRPVIDPPLAVDPTPFIDEEDYDICLLVRNVVTTAGRSDLIYRQNRM